MKRGCLTVRRADRAGVLSDSVYESQEQVEEDQNGRNELGEQAAFVSCNDKVSLSSPPREFLSARSSYPSVLNLPSDTSLRHRLLTARFTPPLSVNCGQEFSQPIPHIFPHTFDLMGISRHWKERQGFHLWTITTDGDTKRGVNSLRLEGRLGEEPLSAFSCSRHAVGRIGRKRRREVTGSCSAIVQTPPETMEKGRTSITSSAHSWANRTASTTGAEVNEWNKFKAAILVLHDQRCVTISRG
ncbi:unnamed protein product [Boreogadus saida]